MVSQHRQAKLDKRKGIKPVDKPKENEVPKEDGEHGTSQ